MTSAPNPRADRARITATVRAYATAIDLRDFDLLRSVVTDPIIIDFTSYDPGRLAVPLAFEAWTEGLRPQLLGVDASLHTIRDPRITLRGDQATSVAAMRADHYFADLADSPVYTMTGHYTDMLARDGDGWRITAKVLTVTSEQGAREMMAAARRRGIERLDRRV
jgi:ketosteroid isomerase-like protein